MNPFTFEHFLFGAFRALSFLPADLLDLLPPAAGDAVIKLPDLFDQKTLGQKTVQALGSFPLTFNLKAGRVVPQPNTSRNFVDILPAGPSRTDKSFLEISLF